MPMGPDLRSPIGNAPVYHTTETASTMDDARRLVRVAAHASGTVVVTDYQSEGAAAAPVASGTRPRTRASCSRSRSSAPTIR